ncbi:MAG: FHA domain-containing protein [Chthoniobacterales bacterium]
MQAKIKVFPPEATPFEVEIGNTATIGRSRDNTVSLSFNPHVSRQHAIVRCHNAYEYQIMDLGSRNGTFVDGRRVITPLTLRHGSNIKICGCELRFEQTEAASDGSGIDVTLAAGTDTGMDETLDVAIMVCDLRGFSTMSERLPEEQVARTLGEWFRHAGNQIQQSGGTIDKFIGDAILAYWPRISTGSNESESALTTARSLIVQAAGQAWPVAEKTPLRVAIAMHHGSVTAGNIGLVAQRDATIIGDAVNTVFRMEGIMKPMGQRLVWSHDFQQALGQQQSDAFDLGEHQLKGKNQLVRIFGIDAPKAQS